MIVCFREVWVVVVVRGRPNPRKQAQLLIFSGWCWQLEEGPTLENEWTRSFLGVVGSGGGQRKAQPLNSQGSSILTMLLGGRKVTISWCCCENWLSPTMRNIMSLSIGPGPLWSHDVIEPPELRAAIVGASTAVLPPAWINFYCRKIRFYHCYCAFQSSANPLVPVHCYLAHFINFCLSTYLLVMKTICQKIQILTSWIQPVVSYSSSHSRTSKSSIAVRRRVFMARRRSRTDAKSIAPWNWR